MKQTIILPPERRANAIRNLNNALKEAVIVTNDFERVRYLFTHFTLKPEVDAPMGEGAVFRGKLGVNPLTGHSIFLINTGEPIYGLSAIMWATLMGNISIVKFLIESGADVNFKTEVLKNDGDELLDKILFVENEQGWTTIMLMALREASRARFSDKEEFSPSILSADKKVISELLRILLKAGAGLDEQNNAGETALMIAVKSYRSDMVELLLKYGAALDITNPKGDNKTAEDYAQGNPEILQLISQHKNCKATTKRKAPSYSLH